MDKTLITIVGSIIGWSVGWWLAEKLLHIHGITFCARLALERQEKKL